MIAELSLLEDGVLVGEVTGDHTGDDVELGVGVGFGFGGFFVCVCVVDVGLLDELGDFAGLVDVGESVELADEVDDGFRVLDVLDGVGWLLCFATTEAWRRAPGSIRGGRAEDDALVRCEVTP